LTARVFADRFFPGLLALGAPVKLGRLVGLAGLVGLLTLPACQSHRAEAAVVVHNVEAVISAPPERKPGSLATLASTPCEDPEVCRVKKMCEDAFGPLITSYRLVAEVRETIAQGGDVDKAALTQKLDEAEAAKEKARGAEERCLIAKAELARKHRL
jgi:hypothetical protein